MSKKPRPQDPDDRPSGWRSLSFHDPGPHLPRRLRLKLAKLSRRRPTVRIVMQIEFATAAVLDLLDAFEDAGVT